MNGDRGYLEFSDAEVEAGIRYALETENAKLMPLMLRMLANETRKLMAEGRGFEDARFRTLLKHLRQRTREEQAERDAYSHAIASMCGVRSGWVKKNKRAAAQRRKAKKLKSSLNEKGQFEIML